MFSQNPEGKESLQKYFHDNEAKIQISVIKPKHKHEPHQQTSGKISVDLTNT